MQVGTDAHVIDERLKRVLRVERNRRGLEPGDDVAKAGAFQACSSVLRPSKEPGLAPRRKVRRKWRLVHQEAGTAEQVRKVRTPAALCVKPAAGSQCPEETL